MNEIQVGDRVKWWSVRHNAKGEKQRVGIVLKIYSPNVSPYAFVKPDKGHGRHQYLSLARLIKLEPLDDGEDVMILPGDGTHMMVWSKDEVTP